MECAPGEGGRGNSRKSSAISQGGGSAFQKEFQIKKLQFQAWLGREKEVQGSHTSESLRLERLTSIRVEN